MDRENEMQKQQQQTTSFTVEELVALNPYNPDILPDLEAYVQEQVLSNTYSLDANLCLLRLYQFEPARLSVQIVARILVKVAETRFASNTIVLRRLIKVKDALTRMVTSANWTVWRQSNSDRATTIRGLILNESWWDRAEYLLKITEPILSMIRYTDMDRPCLGEVYDGIDSKIEDIRNIINEKEQDPDEKFFKELQLIMIERWNKMTNPLHLLAFALSPRFYSQSVLKGSTTRVPPYRDLEVAQGYKAALRRLFPEHLRPAVRAEFMSFASTDDCGVEALEDKNNANAHKWWFYHGEKYQHLQPIGIKILSQALMAMPAPDFNLCMFLIPERLQMLEPFLTLITLSHYLETARFREFWDEAARNRDILEVVPGFEKAIQKYAIHVLSLTYQKLPRHVLAEAINIEGLSLDKYLEVRVNEDGWSLEKGHGKGQLIVLPANEYNHPELKKNTADSIPVEHIARLFPILT